MRRHPAARCHPAWVMRAHPPGGDPRWRTLTLHTDIPTRSEVERLLLARDPSSVSAYLPTSPITQDAQADRIELKNLVADATGQLEAAGADRRSVSDVREALDALVEDDEFWAEQARSLAVFASLYTVLGLVDFVLMRRYARLDPPAAGRRGGEEAAPEPAPAY